MPASRTRPTKLPGAAREGASTGRTTGRTASTRTGWLRDDGQPGFNTQHGPHASCTTPCSRPGAFDPLPHYEEPPDSPVSTPELFEQYPFVLTHGRAARWEFFHSEQRQLRVHARVPSLIRCVEMHPDTAAEMRRPGRRLGAGWRTMRGKLHARRRARSPRRSKPDTVRAEHGWWFPEQEAAEPGLFGVFDSNINNLAAAGRDRADAVTARRTRTSCARCVRRSRRRTAPSSPSEHA